MKDKTRFKRILLAIPPGVEQGGYTPSPLGLLYLVSYLREKDSDITLAVVDGALEGERVILAKLNQFKPDLVGVSVMTPGRHQALKVARLVKRMNPKCKVVFGGIHPSLVWQQMMEHYPEIDYIVRGEGELTLHELVFGRDLSQIKGLVWRDKDGLIINNPNRSFVQNLDNLPFPAWDLVNLSKYPARGEGVVNGINLENEPRFSIIFSRGCMAACSFCSSWRVWSGYRSRSGKNVAREVEFLVQKYKAKHFCFYDDTLTGNREEVINFCQEIIRRKIKVAITGTTRVDKIDAELLKWMKKAGFYELSFGVESGSKAMLAKINKRTDLKEVKKAILLTKKAGIKTVALMMYGLPGEREGDRELTKKLLEELKPDGIGTLGEVWIFPGTALYEQAKSAGIIDDNFWLGKTPYYIYRGGIDNDPINWPLKLRDFLKLHFSTTSFNRLRIKLLGLTERLRDKRYGD